MKLKSKENDEFSKAVFRAVRKYKNVCFVNDNNASINRRYFVNIDITLI